jgi:Flp pilus assembly protein TadB
MIIIVLMLFVLVLCLSVLVSLAQGQTKEETDAQSAAWSRAIQQENSMVGRTLLGVSRPLARMPKLYDQVPTRYYKALQSKLLASGSFGTDVDVFIATQVGAIFAGILLVIIGVVLLSGPITIGLMLLGVGIALYPYNLVAKRAKKRAQDVGWALPDFAELLQMPLTIGQGVMSSLRFTATRLDGPVAQEVRNLEALISSGAANETEAFTIAGERLGTPEARAFFNALLQAQLEGSRVAEIITNQAETLRQATYQIQRAEVKRLPIKMVIIFGIHFLPLLFIVTLVPTIYALSHF